MESGEKTLLYVFDAKIAWLDLVDGGVLWETYEKKVPTFYVLQINPHFHMYVELQLHFQC